MMKSLITDKVKQIPPSGIRKFFDIAAEMDNVISLGVGEPDFDTPWHVREEGIYSLERGRTFYTSNAGMKELREEIGKYVHRKFNLNYDLSEILVTVGGSEGIDLVFRAMLNEGDEVLIPEPCFVSYKPCAILADGKPVVIPLKEENKFKLTAEELEQYITEKTKILVLPFPNNPTGAILEREELEAIAEVVKKHDIFVLSDEIYAELTYEKTHVSIGSLEGMKERTIIINGFSKAYAMTGWRLGYALGPKELISAMTKIHQFGIMCTPTTSQYAAIEALKNGDSDIQEMRKEYNRRRRIIVNGFENMGLKCFAPLGAFYVFPSIKSLGCTSDEFCTELLYDQKVAVIPGTAFGESGEGFIRCSYAYSVENIKEALNRIEKFVSKKRG